MSRRKRRTVTLTVVFEVHEGPTDRQIAAGVKGCIAALANWPLTEDPGGPADGPYRLKVNVDKAMQP